MDTFKQEAINATDRNPALDLLDQCATQTYTGTASHNSMTPSIHLSKSNARDGLDSSSSMCEGEEAEPSSTFQRDEVRSPASAADVLKYGYCRGILKPLCHRGVRRCIKSL